MRPHDSWAEVYDLAYEEEYGAFYPDLTARTLDEIRQLVSPPASIVDFGAGTGRLAIPLARAGYRVTAVEPSEPMLARLREGAGQLDIETVATTMQEFGSDRRFDLAICVFTVVIYLLEETELRKALLRAKDCLAPNGKLLLDVPSPAVFGSHRCRTPRMSREVTIKPLGAGLHDYQERITVVEAFGEEAVYRDRFRIRSWQTNEVLDTARACGLEVLENLSDQFFGSGSDYFVLGRTPS